MRHPFLIIIAALLGLTAASRGAAEADVAVGYSATYGNSVGGADNLEVIAANTVAGSNAINARSGSPARMRLVGCYQSIEDNTNRTSTGGIVGWLGSYDSRISDVVDFGNSVGADLVTYVCTNNDSGSIGAVANQPGRYSAFNPSSFWSTVFAHETGGHNYGCDHRGGDDNPKTVMMHNYCGGGAQGYFSNPNIWLNGARIQGTGTCLGAAVNGGDNTFLLSTAAQDVADRFARVKAAPSLGSVVRHWSFNQPAGNAPAGTTVTDAVSGTALATVQGTGATYTGTGLRLPGGAPGSGAAYLQLPGGLISGYTHVTVEIWATPLSAPNWSRLMDFNNGTSNYIMVSLSNGTNLNAQRIDSMTGGVSTALDSELATATGALHHYAITFQDNGAGGGRWTWYRDGDQAAYVNVNNTLSALQDVNNWLGRSAYAGDSLANCEYREVRISNVAMSRTQVAANYELGPHWQSSTAGLTADDPFGQTSFNAAGRWSDGAAPSAGKSYETYNFNLRTPADGTSRTFAGASLDLSGGGLLWKGTSSSTTTINDFTVRGGCELVQAGSGTWTLAGSMAVASDLATVRAANGPIHLASNLSGNGALLHLNNTVTLSGNNAAFTGKTIVGDGRFSGLVIDSEARLGANPAVFTADQLTLNRGILYCNASMTIDDANRGIRIGESAGLFNVAPGATLTLAVPLSSPASGATLLTAPQFPNPVSGQLIKENTGTLNLTHPNSSYIGEIIIGGGTLGLTGAGRFNNGDNPMPVVNNGTLLIDTTGNQLFGGVISGGGPLIKSNTGTTTLFAANTFTGAVTVNGGTLYANAANAATDRALSQVSGITVNSGATLRSSANALFGWDGTQEKPITVNTGGTLLADGGGTGDVGVGTVTLAGGTLSSTAASQAWGSWRFDNDTDKLLVTQNSTASATNVKFGSAAATLEVAAGRTLNFTGTITNATNGGTSYLTKTGNGTLTLAGTNTYTGATAIQTGVLKLTGSLATGSAVTVSGGATLTGTGTVGGSLTVGQNAIHAPGDTAGTQTVTGALGYAATSRVKWSLLSDSDVAGQASRITAGTVNVTAGAAIDLVLNGPGSTTDFSDAFWSQSRAWTLMTCSAKTGDFTLGTVTTDAIGQAVSGFGEFSLQQSATQVVLHFVPDSGVLTPTETWRQTHFGENWDNLEISGDDADPDRDDMTNLLEYALGSDPNAESSGSRPQVTTEEGKLQIAFTRNTAATDLVLSMVAADNLAGAWTEIARSTEGQPFLVIAAGATVNEQGTGALRAVETTDIHLVTDPSKPKRFMRLSVSRS